MSTAVIDHVTGPTIPERSISLASPRERKRKSLPASPYHDFRRRSSNRVHIKPASPEVINSLIDTLSAISSPAEHHFDNLPNITESRSTPVSPSAWDTHFPRSSSRSRFPPSPLANGFGMDDVSTAETTTSRSRTSYLHPEHALETPTRRSSRADSPQKLSKTKSREAAYEDLLDDAYSIGTPSIMPGQPPKQSPRQPNQKKSLKSLRSARSLKSLARKASSDSMRTNDYPIYVAKREPNPKRERLFLADSRPASSDAGEPAVREKKEPLDAFDLLHTTDDTPASQSPTTSKRHLLDSDNASSSAGPSHSTRSSYTFHPQEYIPTRNSSRRHSAISANRKRRSKPPRSEHSVVIDGEAEAGDDQFHTPPQSPQAAIPEFNESSVNRRIEELKEQKAKRDQLSAEAMSGALNASTRKSREPSPSPSPLAQEQIPDQPPPKQLGLTIPKPHDERPPTPQTPQGKVEECAPSPAVRAFPMRTDRNTESRFNSSNNRPPMARHSPICSRDETKSSTGIHRSSSLLKRMSQPSSPVAAEKHRRRLSKSLSGTPAAPPARNTSYQTDSGDSVNDAVEDYLSSSRLSQTITHPQTGRVISFSEVGDPDGSAVFCCVGMGLTRYITAFYDELATTLKLRLITPDRPGVGGSEPYADGSDTPLTWPDDVRKICEHRGISKFSILAHSAGAIYALATALRMPQHIRCRVHLLAPWIPPSQMSAIGRDQEPLPANAMPYTQRLLRSIPTAFLRAANSSFLSVTSNSFTTSLPRSPRRSKRSMSRSMTPASPDTPEATPNNKNIISPSPDPGIIGDSEKKENLPPPTRPMLTTRGSSSAVDILKDSKPQLAPTSTTKPSIRDENASGAAVRRHAYEMRLASQIWDRAITNANPSVDLLVCLERKQPIGFRYVDITRAVVIHHGSKDSRVPVENVKWLGKMMRRCEVRVLEGEGHGLMASAGVMGSVLMEMAGEWEDWNRVVRGNRKG